MLPVASSLTFLLGAGGGLSHAGGLEDPNGPTFRATAEISAGYKVSAPVALGVHARVSRARTWNWASGVEGVDDYDMRTLDVGISCQINADRLYFEPWLGTHLARGTQSTYLDPGAMRPSGFTPTQPFQPAPLLAAGMLFGIDVIASSRDRLALFIDFEIAPNDQAHAHGPGDEYIALTFGIAVHR